MRKLFISILLFPFVVNAQQLLTLENVIDTTLENNFDIRIAENNLSIAKSNNNLGVAGGMPVVIAAASDNGSINNISQKNSTGTVTNYENVNGNTLNTGVTASITLFNGFKVTATKERLSLLQRQNEYLLNHQVQTALASVMIKYYDIIRQQYYLDITQRLLDFSNKKLEIVATRKQVGMADGIEMLQAQMDVNTAKENVKIQQLVVEQAKADLLLLMSSKSRFPFVISDSIIINRALALDSVLASLNTNPMYLTAVQQVQISQQVVKEVSAQRYPSVKLNTSYNFMQTDNSTGSMLMNQVYGPSAGISLQVPIYYGGAYKAQREVAKYSLSNSKLQEESLLNTMKTYTFKTYQSYITNLGQLEEQQENYEMAKKLVNLVLQNFQLNQATILEVNAAQSSFETAGYLLINIQYAAKTAEIQLLSLMYKLK